jgi:hypothetical protein
MKFRMVWLWFVWASMLIFWAVIVIPA